MKKIFFIFVVLFWFAKDIHSQCTPVIYNDPENQPHYAAMNIPCAWTITNGDPNIVVTAFDIYFDNAHPELVGKVVDIIGNCDETGVIRAEYTHGNQSLGAVAALRNNGICGAGSGGNTRVMGYCGGADDSALQAAVTNGSDILAVSTWYPGGITKSKLEELTFNGVSVLLAGLCEHHDATNPNGIHSVPGVIHVGRAHLDGSFFPYLVGCPNDVNQNMDVLVITDFLSRIGEGASCELSSGGTSLGTPTLAGVVALMKSVNSCISPADIEEILVQTAAPSPDPATRAGVINAYAAVLAAQNFTGMDRTLSGIQNIDYYQVSGDLLITTGSGVIINKKFRSGNNSKIIVEAGAKLTFGNGCESYFGEGSRIIVKRGGKLLLDGAKLTTGGCTQGGKWQGIVVEGNSSNNQQILGNSMSNNLNGIVEIINNSIIENAKTAVSMNADHLPWPTIQDYRGGLVVASNSTFQNNDRAFEFMQYFREENSVISGCYFNGHINVATHWSNFGTTYIGNTFENYSKNALHSYDAQFNVIDGNTFDGDGHTQYDEAAVDMYYTYPGALTAVNSGSKIGGLGYEPNYFFGDYHGVFCDGCATTFETEVVNNIFSGNWRGITFHGIGNHLIQYNDLIGQLIGSQIADNGTFGNIMAENNFSSNDVANYAYRDNSGFEFQDNCYDFQATRDVRLHDADLNDFIGSPNKAAGNVFTYPYSIRSISVSGLTTPSRYYVPSSLQSNPTQSRLVPQNYQVTVYSASQPISPVCGSTQSPGPTRVIRQVCTIPSNCEQIKTFILQKEQELNQAYGNLIQTVYLSNQWYQLRLSISTIKRCLQNAKIKLIWACRPKINYNEFEQRFANDEFIFKTYLYGLMVENQEYNKARIYLNSLQTTKEEDVDFIVIQNINLDRLEAENYVPQLSTLTTVKSIGEKSLPFSGYARSLYKMLTGSKLELQIPPFIEDNSELRNDLISANSKFNINPNPVVDVLNISYKHDHILTANIMEISGKILKSFDLETLEGSQTVDISDLNGGIYILVLREKSGAIVHKEQVVKI